MKYITVITHWIKVNLVKRSTLVILSVFIFLLFLTSQGNNQANNDLMNNKPSLQRDEISLHLENEIDDESTATVQMEHCKCARKIEINNSKNPEDPDEVIYYNQTTCSQDAFRRGREQKIVGFSFYGDVNAEYSKKKGYFEGIKGNLKLLPKYYPGWIMRLYFDLDPADPILTDLCDLACSNSLLDLCHAGQLPGTPMTDARKVFPMNWRFFPTLDPQVDVYVCRDLDSRFSDREFAAVQEWLASSQPIHSMRDHPAHYIPLLGAAWGSYMTKKNARGRWKKSWQKILRDPNGWANRTVKGPDQEVLRRYVWTWAKHSSIQHDSYLCEKFPGGQPFPTRRLNETNNYVASVYNENSTLWKRCPPRCRPKEHQDWEHC